MRNFFLSIFFCLAGITVQAQAGISSSIPWEFIKGDSAVPQNNALYGTIGAAGESNKPGARLGGITWTDASGNLWLFGGSTVGNGGSTFNKLNDLWKFDPTTSQWTFMKGDNNSNVPGDYGIRGVPADDNNPGAREGSVSWTDATGNLWLFGGSGFSSGLTAGNLNDLWKYDPATNQWTWIKGDNATGVPGRYGALGIAAPDNNPGGRTNSISWTDAAGNFWLFGGNGVGSLNDLWKYDITSNNWTWIKGDSLFDISGVYGNLQVTAASNKPGSRYSGVSWTDGNGKLWLLGGRGLAGSGDADMLNDLWKFDPVSINWTWMKGDSITNATGIYGSLGIAAATNKPGARYGGLSWSDATGNLWLFGGVFLSDLWKFDVLTNDWTWVKGDNTFNVNSVFGIRGVANATNKPGARIYGVSWKDGSGNFWLHGGFGGQSSNPFHIINGRINDLWKYNTSTNQWTWMKGDTTVNVASVYGSPGLVAEGNSPGAREGSVMWKDGGGNLWLFGGDADTAGAVGGFKNDLWKYDVGINQWIWMKGDSTKDDIGVYGSPGVAAAGNKPGARFGSLSWTDAAGNLWLFGGYGFPVTGVGGYFNDLWKYDPASNNWTWIKGDNSGNNAGVYGTQGTAAAGNKPGARYNGISWIDASGKFWLFGGFGSHSSGFAYLNDLWKYDPVTNNWTWMKGDNTGNITGVYGTQGLSSAANKPGSRFYSVPWADASGNLWLFGGYGYDASSDGFLNDLWKYNIGSNQWTWMKGDNIANNAGVYGTQGILAAGNKPGGRYAQMSWNDGAGNLWMFGGLGYAEFSTGNLSDLWKYDPGSNQWSWMKGDKEANQLAGFGAKGIPDAATKPAAIRNSGWSADGSGNFWLYGGKGNTANGENLVNTLFRFNTSTSQWTWMKGVKSYSNQGVFGVQGSAVSINKPGARAGSVSWTDSSQNLWLFGGKDFTDYLNDLWKYDPIEKQWTWIKGDSSKNSFAGVYGSLNTPAITNTPGAREGSVSWTDSLGKLWLFGGTYTQGGTTFWLNDLWKFDPATNQWTWIKGDNTTNATGVYGSQGTPATANKPGAREGSVSCIDRSGNLWLFGGVGFSTSSFAGQLNDLWKFNPATNQWTFMKGNSSINVLAVYGTQGTAASTNKPGARNSSVSWIDSTGKLWLFGGSGFTTSGSYGKLSDLWKYDPVTNNWTWMKGDNTLESAGSYGSSPAAGNKPGAREGSIAWKDVYNNLWLFGGYGYGVATGSAGHLLDLWRYNTATNEWTWIKGDGTINSAGNNAGTVSNNKPGSRTNAIAWTDGYGDFWLFGGYGFGTSGIGPLNDLWKIFGGTRFIFRGNGLWSSSSQWLNFVAPPTTLTAGMDVIIDHSIPGGCTNTGPVTIQKFGRLTVESQKLLTIDQGGLSNSGSLIGPGNLPGKVLFTGTNLDSLRSVGSTTTPLVLLSKNLYLTGNTHTSTINLLGNITGRSNSGGTSTITLGNFNLNMDTASLVADKNNFIITNSTGKLKRFVGADPVTFHIGADVNSYTPVTITAMSIGQLPFNDTFSVSVRPGIISAGLPAVPVTDSAVNRTWIIKKATAGPGSVTLSVQWNLGDELPGFNRLSSFIAHKFVCPPPDPPNCSSSYYDAVASSAATGNNPFIQTRDNVTGSFNNDSSFIVTSQSAEFRFINVNPNGVGDGNWNNPLNWTNLQVAPTTITAGMNVIIDPMVGNECIFTGTLIVQPGGKLTIGQGKKLTIRPF